MIRDVTGTKLTPGNLGKDCLGNGKHFDKNGKRIECCCNECDYYMCCIEEHSEKECESCNCFFCPHCKNKLVSFFKFLMFWKR